MHIPAQVREIYDVSGAGDTVIATFATGLGAGLPVRNAALLANVAAGIVVGKTGTATARLDEIRAALEAEPVTEKTFVTSNFTLVCPGRASVASGSNSWKKGLLLSPQSGLRKC